MTSDALLNGLDMIELVSGVVFGIDRVAVPRRRHQPREALEGSLLGPLADGPCGVAFSGGRDSSGVLAAATAAARSHGLPDPVPVTLRFPTVASTEESDHQEAVVRHLGITEWVRIEPGDALDILGESSTALTARHGMLYPSNVHIVVPMLEALGSGTLLTGAGGDEMLDGHAPYDLAAMVTGRARPTRARMRALAKRYLAPERIRDESRRMALDHFTWLVPDIRDQVAERFASTAVERLFAHRQITDVVYPARYLHRMQADMSRIAADHGMRVAHPFLDPGFAGALAHRAGRTGYRDRTAAMEDLFGGVLPAGIIARTSKASFDDVFWTARTDGLVDSLPVELLAEYVDPAALRERWRSELLKGNTALIVKYLWQRQVERPPGAANWVGRPSR